MSKFLGTYETTEYYIKEAVPMLDFSIRPDPLHVRSERRLARTQTKADTHLGCA